MVAYFLITIGLLTAIPILVGAVWAMVKKNSAGGTIYHSHYVNATRTFWWSILWTVIGCILLAAAGLGAIILGVTWLWVLYRMIRGFAIITSDDAYPL